MLSSLLKFVNNLGDPRLIKIVASARAFLPAFWGDALLVSSLKETAIPGENLVICLLMISSKLGGGAGRRQADSFFRAKGAISVGGGM